jgi:5-methylcytosine-specific restriction endonuclease McrA
LLTRKEKYLSIRSFSEAQKISVYEKQNGKCANPKCPDAEKFFEISEMEADHITPWSEGGKTELENCQMLCRECNRRKGKS